MGRDRSAPTRDRPAFPSGFRRSVPPSLLAGPAGQHTRRPAATPPKPGGVATERRARSVSRSQQGGTEEPPCRAVAGPTGSATTRVHPRDVEAGSRILRTFKSTALAGREGEGAGVLRAPPSATRCPRSARAGADRSPRGRRLAPRDRRRNREVPTDVDDVAEPRDRARRRPADLVRWLESDSEPTREPARSTTGAARWEKSVTWRSESDPHQMRRAAPESTASVPMRF